MSGLCYKPTEVYLGIDLGTTNSCAYFSIDGKDKVGVTYDGIKLLPSYILFKKADPFQVGSKAKKDADRRKVSVVFNTKRVIGRIFNDPEVQTMLNRCGSPIVEKDGYPYFKIGATGELQSPTDIGTKIVQHIIEQAEKKSDSKVTRICITVPAHFNNNQRNATEQCVVNCGFTRDQVEIVNEPTAAAITYFK